MLTDDSDGAATHEWLPEYVRPVAALIATRWVLPIVDALHEGPLRRNALRERLGSVSDKVLTETLRRMEADQLVVRTAVASVPMKVDYALSPLAYSLWLLVLQRWSVRSHYGARTRETNIAAPLPPSRTLAGTAGDDHAHKMGRVRSQWHENDDCAGLLPSDSSPQSATLSIRRVPSAYRHQGHKADVGGQSTTNSAPSGSSVG